MKTEMTIEKENEIRKQYAEADEAFRAAKKDRRASAAKVSQLKAKRDGLSDAFDQAIKFLKEHNALTF
jgi:hypothetical protein